jgi:DNA polymerase-4
MDAFYAAVEQRDRPELRGKALLIGHDSPRSVVCTASYEARPYGVGSAMPMGLALRKCPHALVIPPRMARYAEVSEQIMDVFAQFSPRVEALSLDEAFLDMTGAEGLFGPPEAMARAIKAAVWQRTALNVSVGVAACKYVAKVASDIHKPDALLVIPPDQQITFLAELPISRLWGVGAKSQERLRDLGLRTIGDVAASDPGWLQRHLGSMGPHIYALAHADDPRPVVGEREATSLSAEETLDTDVVGAARIRPYLLHAADRVAARLRRAGLVAGGVRVKLKTHKFALHTRQVTLPAPTHNAAELYAAALALLPAFDLTVPMRLIGLGTFDLRDAAAPVQTDLFADGGRKKNARLDAAMDVLKQKFGTDAVQRAVDLDAAPRPRHLRPGNKRDAE